MIVADKNFIIDSPRERVWQLLLRVVMRCMPFESMELVDEKNYFALLKIGIGCIALPVRVQIEITDIFEPESLVTILKARGMGGMVWLNQKATFTLTSLSESKTQVTCNLVAQGMARLLRIFFLWRVKSFAQGSLENIEALLRQWA